MPDNFDMIIPATAFIDGDLTAEMRDQDLDRNNVLDRTQNNSIVVRWTQTGVLVPVLSGHWELSAQFEQIGGPGGTNEFQLPATPLQIPYGGNTYTQSIPLPANSIPAGAYKVVVLLSHFTPANTPTRMAGYVELPVVRFI